MRAAPPVIAAPMTPVSELADAFDIEEDGPHEDDGIPF